MPDTVFYGWTESALPSAKAEQQATQQWQWAAAAFEYARKVAGYNAQEVASYNNLYSQYEAARNNRPDLPEPFPPPVPSYAMIVMTSESSWPYMAYSTTERVCATKAYVPAAKPELARGKVGPHVYDDPDGTAWFGWLPGDLTMPGQAVHVVSSDGIEGIFVKQKSLVSGDSGKGGQVPGYYIKKG